ncbi:MAG TPA: hypothetical protein VIG33_14800 [Pseudobdellovibrionaceae bacterium]|jgi:hypothetical protein
MTAGYSVRKFPIKSPQFKPRLMTFGVTTGHAQVETLTFPAVAGATQGDFVVLYNEAGQSIAAYIDIDAAGTAPTSPLYTAATYKVAISVATGDLAAAVATAFRTAVNGVLPDVTFTLASATCICTQDIVGDCSNAVLKNSDGTGVGSITNSVGTEGLAAVMTTGGYDGTLTQTATGVYTITFERPFLRIPEYGITTVTDNRVPRISSGTVSTLVVEVSNLSGGATIDGSFHVLVVGSDAKDAIRG